MNQQSVFSIVVISLLIAACGREPTQSASEPETTPTETAAESKQTEETVLTAATLGEQTVMTAADYLSGERYGSANPDNGKAQAQICKACHSLDAGGPNMVGPGLHGFFGRKAGSTDFDYSAALKDADFIWTPRALDAWLAQPGRFLPGNKMTFVGVPEQQDRDDLIAYLLQQTAE